MNKSRCYRSDIIIAMHAHKNTELIKVQLRNAKIEDIEFIKQCLIDSWVIHARNNSNLITEERMINSNIENYYYDSILNNDGYTLIAEINHKKVGLIRAYEKEIADFFKDNRILYIDDIYVLEHFRRKGIARKLILKIESIAKEKGIKRIDGRIYSFNLPIQKLLKSLGYKSPYATWVKVLQ